MSLREVVLDELGTLSEQQLAQVADYVSFLKFRSRRLAPEPDDAQLAALYEEAADEDRALAELGMEDYAATLVREDAAR